MTTDEVENIIKEIQPLESMLSQSNSLPTNSVLDCESERPNKRSKTSTESLFTLSAYENQGLEDLINILNKDAIGSELSVEICPEDKISRWLRSCPSQSVCRMLYNLSAKHKESSEQFWLRGLSPLSCHLLTDHFQAVHADPLFKEEFFEMLHEAIPNREEVLTKMNEGTETLMKFAYQRVLENNNIIESKIYRDKPRTVNFKDLSIRLNEETESCEDASLGPRKRISPKAVEKQKLIIIIVGLPARGKTFLCNKLVSYLTWIGHDTMHFNVGKYRRQLGLDDQFQAASLFDHGNKTGLELRNKALHLALVEMLDALDNDKCQVALFDATNTTEARRQYLTNQFEGRYQYMFIESICNDEEVLEQNYRNKMKYSPDYIGMDSEEAIRDFKQRIQYYAKVYEPISDRKLHYIKLIDMVTGRGYLDVNRISGYLGGKIVFFLMQICKSGANQVRKIWLTRHGESEYNRLGLIGGDSSLSTKGECYAQVVPEALFDRLSLVELDSEVPLSIWTSTLQRTIQTAQYLPFPKLRWKALDEINAGRCDGMTYEEIKTSMPDEYYARQKDKLAYRYPFGESYLDVIQRLEPVIIEMERQRESICLIAHQAIIRAIYTYFMRLPLDECPSIEVPLHTIIELTPMPNGTMNVERIPVRVASPPCSPMKSPVMRFVDTNSSNFFITRRHSEPKENQVVSKSF
eukprot:g1908.t1